MASSISRIAVGVAAGIVLAGLLERVWIWLEEALRAQMEG